jgi:hypothetical protein
MERDRYLTCEQLVEALDDYLDLSSDGVPTRDGRVSGPVTHAAVEAHLATCPACPAIVADVRAIRQAARTLEPMAPPEHVWHQVRARVSLETPPRTSLFGLAGPAPGWRALFQPLGATAALVLVVGSITWVGSRLVNAPPVGAAGSGALAEFQLAEAEYTDAIARLEEAAEAAGPQLDALTGAALQSSIDDIDVAIGDARDALVREPADALSQESLLDALGSKVTLLQDTVALLGDLEPATEDQNP